MKLQYQTGDILKAKTDAIVNPVNCVGVMGAGLAAQFKKKYRINFDLYEAACGYKQIRPGRVFVTKRHICEYPRYIVNFPTKRHWKDKSRLGDIVDGLIDLRSNIHEFGIRSVSIPRLGCGLGGLDWEEVKPHVEDMASRLCDCFVYVVYKKE